MDGDNAPLEDQDSDTEEYSVDRIIGKKSINGIPHYNVQFTGSFVFVALLNKQQIVNCDHMNNYGRPELFVSDFSARMARFGRQRRCESFVC